jgi:hypothetical protein
MIPSAQLSDYVALYKNQQTTIQAYTSYEAQQKAATELKVPRNRQHLISVHYQGIVDTCSL